MVLDRIFSVGRKEQEALAKIRRHLEQLCTACQVFGTALEQGDREALSGIADLEREGDALRREIFSTIYDGAFLPMLRPGICTFVELVDKSLDLVADMTREFLELPADRCARADCLEELQQVAQLNREMCEMLVIAFDSLTRGEKLREKTLAIRIYEKRIDEIKYALLKKLRETEVKDFWEGKLLSDFVSHLTELSDLVEDASDYLQILNISLR